ncbi:MAG: hypothetical protein ACLFS7_05550 [Desulfosudaceae bacterium]
MILIYILPSAPLNSYHNNKPTPRQLFEEHRSPDMVRLITSSSSRFKNQVQEMVAGRQGLLYKEAFMRYQGNFSPDIL